MSQSRGYIFIVTLLFTAVISLIVLTLMQHLLLYHKLINKQALSHQRFYQLEQTALRIVLSPESGCVRSGDSINAVMLELIHGQGCTFMDGTTRYQYLIEALGEFPCMIVHSHGQPFASLHRRISIVRQEGGTPASLLQIRVILAGSKETCLQQKRYIPLGVSSWRYFAAF